ncbi:MAG: hypothetical protein QE487_09995 [Fluviicola sp.]|nr:hypothetical protein [Fluviicola sp.]
MIGFKKYNQAPTEDFRYVKRYSLHSIGMKNMALLVILTIIVFAVQGQSLPEKIIVAKNTYQSQSFIDDDEVIYCSDTLLLSDKDEIAKLYSALTQFDTEEQLLTKFGIDTNYILNNPNDMLKLYDGFYQNKIDWNDKQKELLFKELANIGTYKSALNDYLSQGCCYTMHNSYRYEYEILMYSNNEMIHHFTSRKSVGGYLFPFVDQSNNTVYSFAVDKQLKELFKQKNKIKEPLFGNDLLKHIVNQTIEDNMKKLYKLSAYSYEKEISELSTDFDIISSEEVYGRGRYIGGEPKTLKITLRNKHMLSNVQIQFLASVVENSIYSRDSIKTNYQAVLNKVQSLDFITEYLENDKSATLDIYFFNNAAINEYNILNINKTPEEWGKHDKYVESLKRYETAENQRSFDVKKAIATSERVNCGCNLRKEKTFFDDAVFFEIRSSRNPISIWFLLPDGTVLLHHLETDQVEGAHVLDKNLGIFSSDFTVPFACLLFNEKGELIKK